MAGGAVLTAVYDLAVSPPTFDFLGFLVSAERYRIERGLPSMRVLVAPGPDSGFRRDNLPPREPERRHQMLQSIVLPMARLLPSCVEARMLDEQDSISGEVFPIGWSVRCRAAHYGTDKIVQALQAGCVPLQAKPQKRDKNLIVITVRQSDAWPTRNSNLPAWLSLAATLKAEGLRPLFIPDGWEVRGFKPYETDAKAALDLHRRAALYERARLCLFVNNGPMAMAMFQAKARSLVFKMCAADAPSCSPNYFAGCGLPVGSQIGRPDHRIVWSDDDAGTLIRETFAALDLVECD